MRAKANYDKYTSDICPESDVVHANAKLPFVATVSVSLGVVAAVLATKLAVNRQEVILHRDKSTQDSRKLVNSRQADSCGVLTLIAACGRKYFPAPAVDDRLRLRALKSSCRVIPALGKQASCFRANYRIRRWAFKMSARVITPNSKRGSSASTTTKWPIPCLAIKLSASRKDS